MIAAFGQQNSLPIVATRRKFKTAESAQEAHEAIRPTHFDSDVSALDAQEKALYDLILKRAVACQMTDVVYAVRRVKLTAEELVFSAVGRTLKDKGWRAFGVEAEVEPDEAEAAASNPIPHMAIGQTIIAGEGKVTESWTRAPSRYTKASLVEKLKELGIGRPATYATAVDGLERKEYVEIEKRRLVPTPLANQIYGVLKGKFAFIEYGYTKRLEEDLDAIAAGKKTYDEVVRAVQDNLQLELAVLGVNNTPRAPKPHAMDAAGKKIECPKCGKPMVKRTSAKGEFYGCTGYPDCKGTAKV